MKEKHVVGYLCLVVAMGFLAFGSMKLIQEPPAGQPELMDPSGSGIMRLLVCIVPGAVALFMAMWLIRGQKKIAVPMHAGA